ncbi:hypothetical protein METBISCDRAFT_27128 [Metschnikowia bicuspidata]|uniref:SH3 domain-containing protein n=1 Tax=Metschnikowia bicuspidata TaxID=27322 RepID=A0A4P9ZDA1_9ASCO|nr:hypothetical protein METBISCDRAFT_27128 [Metschnikowia bicuspidata]
MADHVHVRDANCMPEETLTTTNRVLRDLERKISLALVSLTASAQLHGSVVRDPQHGGLARESIQLSVIDYIRNHSGPQFDADAVYRDRQRLITTFDREYLAVPGSRGRDTVAPGAGIGRESRISPESSIGPGRIEADRMESNSSIELCRDAKESPSCAPEPLGPAASLAGPKTRSKLPLPDLRRSSLGSATEPYNAYFDDDFDSYCESDTENDPANPDSVLDVDENILLPPLPPRMPPKELDPNRLYGLFDFSSADPLHCTLLCEEPVYLVNDLDNYWWLIRKLTKAERLARNPGEDFVLDEEDGKIGFVPAECLETHGERLARLNCYRNEELEKSARSSSPFSYDPCIAEAGLAAGLPHQKSLVGGSEQGPDALRHQSGPPPETAASHANSGPNGAPMRCEGSILKKSGCCRLINKLVTFENLATVALDNLNDNDPSDSDSDSLTLSYKYYGVSHDDIGQRHEEIDAQDDIDRNSEILSDVYPADMPLHIPKSGRDPLASVSIAKPKLSLSDDSIGTYSPDTPPQRCTGTRPPCEAAGEVRRSVILDKLSAVTSVLSCENILLEYRELSFGGSLTDAQVPTENTDAQAKTAGAELDCEDDDGSLLEYLDSRQFLVDELATPLTSTNSLTLPSTSPKENKRKTKYEVCLPVLDQLEELTKKLAELENLFD